MTTPTPECPACRVRMQEGSTLEIGRDGRVGPTQWVEGALEKSWVHGLKVKGRKIDTVTFRCPKCGWLIWFAPEPAETEG